MVIVAAVDRSDRASNVLEEAEKLATAFDDTIHVVHVMTTTKFINLGRTEAQMGDPVDMDEVHSIAAEIAAEAAADLDAPWEAVGLMGDPADEIVYYAAETGARYVVVGPRKRSAAGKALFGSVAQSILLNSDVPVVTTIGERTLQDAEAEEGTTE